MGSPSRKHALFLCRQPNFGKDPSRLEALLTKKLCLEAILLFRSCTSGRASSIDQEDVVDAGAKSFRDGDAGRQKFKTIQTHCEGDEFLGGENEFKEGSCIDWQGWKLDNHPAYKGKEVVKGKEPREEVGGDSILDQGQVLDDEEDIINFIVKDEMGNLSLLTNSGEEEEEDILDFICMGDDGSLSVIR
ncbi:hypothetical protein BOTCAL_0025g00080 [Botryotinia calthae]|uniref:Uncharacterized protein n=1 Tax=Botryotinia calthae TaxID=38488 RepID=A0A4Y8DEC7_9HELO|nr:hypothetical protein BOTCAL_0025g00080 [Botryotinia calthae]